MSQFKFFNSELRFLPAIVLTVTTLIMAACGGSDGQSQALEHLERGETYANQGQFRAAMIEMRNAVQKYPDDHRAPARMAELMIIAGSSRQASDLLSSWQGQGHTELDLLLAEAYIKQSKHVSAREVLEAQRPVASEHELVFTALMADADRLAGRFDDAEAGYRRALELEPAHQPAVSGLSRLYLVNNRVDEAMELTREWQSSHGADPDLKYLEAQVFYQQNNLETAATTLTEGLEALRSVDVFLPQRRQLLTLLSRTLTEQGRLTDAMVYNEILREHTDNTLAESTEAAVEAIAAGDLDTARTTLQELLSQHPDSELVAMLLGAVSVYQGDLEGGSELLAESLDAETSPTPFIRLATIAQVDLNQRKSALATLDRALLARPSDVDLLAMHGILALADPARAEDGVISLQRALQNDSERTRLRLALAQHYLRTNQVEQALGHLRTAFDTSPDDWPITDFYLTTLAQNNLNNEIHEVRDALANNYPNDPYATFLIASVDFRAGDSEAAVRRLRNNITDGPDWIPARNALAQMYAQKGERENAIAEFLDLAELTPDNPNALREAGRLMAADRSDDEVLDWLLGLAEERPAIATTARILAAQVNIQRQQFSTARQLLADIEANENPAASAVFAQLAIADARQAAGNEEWRRARSLAGEAISLQPQNANHVDLLVRIVAAEGNIDEALELLAEAQNNNPGHARLALTRAVLVADREGPAAAYRGLQAHWEDYANPEIMSQKIGLAVSVSPDDVIPLAESWTAAQPGNFNAWMTLADIQLQSGNEVAAENGYRQALALQPDNVIALNNLAWVLRNHNAEEAIDLARRAVDNAPGNASILDTYGWVLHLNGRSAEALEVLEQAHNLAPDDPAIQAHLEEARNSP